MLTLKAIEIEMQAARLKADFALNVGQKVAILGPSGAGKSTLLDAIAGFRPLGAGQVLWWDQDLSALAPQARPVSILFQDSNLFPHLSIERNLGLALRPGGGRPDKAEKMRIAQSLERVGLAGFAQRLPGTLSGGEQGRAALARVLLQARPVLLLDEPFAALGPALKQDMLALVSEVVEDLGALCLMVTHDPRDAQRFADAVIVLAEGRASPPVETGALFANPPELLRGYLGE